MTDSKRWLDARELRTLAEQRLAQLRHGGDDLAGGSAPQLHELQVHQIELEMQNEALMRANAETEDALQRLGKLNVQLEELVMSRTAELVVARDAADAASRAKSSFLSNMSHELRTPLSGVVGLIDLAILRPGDVKQIEWMKKAKTSAERMLTVVNDVLELSRIEAGHLTLQSVDFRLNEVLDELTALLAPAAAIKGLEFTSDLPVMLDQLTLMGDSFRLKQILLYLTVNAVKFTAAGEVGLHVRMVQESATELLLCFEVRDTGIGISAQDQARLFSPFEQASSSTTRRFGDLGLGLAISSRLARMMGGSIAVDSVPGTGSSFQLTVRLKKSDVVPGVAPRPDGHQMLNRLRADFAGAHILLVEDDPINQTIATAVLEGAGLRVDLAPDGAVAVVMAGTTSYALILMDVQMPVMAGDEACRIIRRIPAHATTPIVALTANALVEVHKRCREAGMDEVLSKPIRAEDLFQALLKLLPNPG